MVVVSLPRLEAAITVEVIALLALFWIVDEFIADAAQEVFVNFLPFNCNLFAKLSLFLTGFVCIFDQTYDLIILNLELGNDVWDIWVSVHFW